MDQELAELVGGALELEVTREGRSVIGGLEPEQGLTGPFGSLRLRYLTSVSRASAKRRSRAAVIATTAGFHSQASSTSAKDR